MEQLKRYLNLEAIDEIHMFLIGNKKKTAQMKYDQFVKQSLAAINPVIREYIKEQELKFRECRTISALEALQIPALPIQVLEVIMELVDKPKDLNLVERTYLCLDLTRAVTSQIGTTVGHMVMHYATAIRKAPTIVDPTGKPL